MIIGLLFCKDEFIQMSTKLNAKTRPFPDPELLSILQLRFENNMDRHRQISWKTVLERLEKYPAKMLVLQEMESTGGEPDVIDWDSQTGECLFYDCSAESPAGRRSLCYDKAALISRKEHPPVNAALEMALHMGVELLTEMQYRFLQEKGNFDQKTSSWVATPSSIRKKGGALFCDRRYGHVFLYHNGAASYYAARGFRALLRV